MPTLLPQPRPVFYFCSSARSSSPSPPPPAHAQLHAHAAHLGDARAFRAYFPRHCQEPAPGGWRCFPSTPLRRGTRRCRLRQLSLAVTLQARLPLQRLVGLPTPEFLSASRCRRKAPCSWPRTRRRSKEDLERAEEMKFRCTELLRRME